MFFVFRSVRFYSHGHGARPHFKLLCRAVLPSKGRKCRNVPSKKDEHYCWRHLERRKRLSDSVEKSWFDEQMGRS